jgi:hypothetical protein
MKYITLILTLLSTAVFASQEVSISYMRINQNLEFKQPINFKMDALNIGYSYWHDSGFGIKIDVARSTETANSFILAKKYTNKIPSLWQGHLAYKYDFDKLSLIVSAGITEYKSVWWVDGKKPAWSEGSDSYKPSWCIIGQYRIERNFKIKGSYCDMYEKYKKGYGPETTDAISIGLVYLF